MIVISLFVELSLVMLCGTWRSPRPLTQVVGNLPETVLREGDTMSCFKLCSQLIELRREVSINGVK